MANLVVPQIPNGACLQLGIGGMPNTIGSMIAQSDLKDLSVHTEMYVDGFVDMAMAGKITGKHKQLDKGRQVFAFAAGTQKLYDYMDRNPNVMGAPVDYTNDVHVISQIDNFISINNIVDVTNYIMFAYGQPLHCFDADMIKGGKVVVKTMPEGTPFVTLDGEEHKLSDRDLAICNVEEPMCIAGVFGGKGSGTYETTRNVLLESAYFNPTWIRKSARRHGLSTDASFRFERGIDPNGVIYALKQAAMLCKELAGGEIAMEIKDVYPNPLPDFVVDLNYEYAYGLMGKTSGRIRDEKQS